MIRLFEFQDLNKIMELWLQGNKRAHAFINTEYWDKKFDSVKSIIPNAEVYVYEENGEILGFIGMEADYIAGLFVSEEYRRRGIGHLLIAAVKKKKRLSLHVYKNNENAVEFYLNESFLIKSETREKETGEIEYLMVYEA